MGGSTRAKERKEGEREGERETLNNAHISTARAPSRLKKKCGKLNYRTKEYVRFK